MNKIKEVAFLSERLKESYLKLEKGKFEDKQLFSFIKRAINDLKENPYSGIQISKKLIPKDYLKKYAIDNLWKYNLPNAWRLLYSIVGNDIKIVSVIIEWFSHKKYERKFKY